MNLWSQRRRSQTKTPVAEAQPFQLTAVSQQMPDASSVRHFLEHIPKKLVVDLVVILYLGRLYKRAQQP
jgi:hypothetical protein